MTELRKVSNDLEIEITDENLEVNVEVNYRCWFETNRAFYPMNVSGSIYKGYSLSQFKNEHKKSYEKNYMKVEVVDVFIDYKP